MFEYLLEIVFPFVGDFFGILSGLAQIDVAQFISMITGQGVTFEYVNILTGVVSTFHFTDGIDLPIVGDLIENAFSVILQMFFVGVPLTTPIWIALPLAMVEGMLLFIVLRWGLQFLFK